MLLPDPKRRGEIHFIFAKAMPYTLRLAVMLLLLISGFTFQIFFDFLFTGLAFLLVASLLSTVKGYTNVPDELGSKGEWRAGDKKQLEKIIDVSEKAKSWDQSLLDITCSLGCFFLISTISIFALFYFLMSYFGYEQISFTISVDAAALLFPHWITGVRRILTNAPLIVKVKNLLYVYSLWEADKRDGESMTVQLEVVKGKKGEMPADAKLILQIPALGESFFGVQTQVVLNSVQGSDYPYVYCVLVAKHGLGMRSKLANMKAEATSRSRGLSLIKLLTRKPPELCIEWKCQEGMDILIIRQQTTKQSGYHTDHDAVAHIFKFALGTARSLPKQ